ncbi:MAG: hypothetical protein HKL80_01780 [Acidimicrobiales bacterium]|nr:hypothetical protein [Acidimicrobiales bacterium]
MPDRQEGERTVSLEIAVARYLRVLRNAVHTVSKLETSPLVVEMRYCLWCMMAMCPLIACYFHSFTGLSYSPTQNSYVDHRQLAYKTNSDDNLARGRCHQQMLLHDRHLLGDIKWMQLKLNGLFATRVLVLKPKF